MRPFVRVAGNLSLSVSELSANIPAFNPQKTLLAEAAGPGAPPVEDAPDGEIDAEVSFFTRDLATVLPRAKIAAVIPIDDVLAHVRDAANWSGAAPEHAVPDLRPNVRMAYAAEGTPDPYAGFEPRIAPENITLLPKTECGDHRRQRLERAHHHPQEGRLRRQRAARSRGHCRRK